jgi:hypothetical protein
MAKIKLAGAEGSLNADPSVQEFRDQIGALVDALRQIGGNASIVAGNLEQADPFSSPFTLYVNPYIGSDRFVGGSYNTHESGSTDEEIIASKLRRIELQRLECGYTQYRPFKTINRAIIEAAIITSKNWYTYTDPRAHLDCVSIVLAPGVHIIYNDPGAPDANIGSWGSEKDPTIADLIKFNPVLTGGVLLPRGCSLCGPDLRKTTLRPNWVPPFGNEQSGYTNRRAVMKVTGTGYFFGYTGMDKLGFKESHHLLDLHGPASKEELDLFYSKCEVAVGEGADLASALLRTRSTEYEIVGPIVAGQLPNASWDTTASASPYIFNCSIRSDYGMGGAFWDGDKVSGLKSMVCANFTGVSLQKDMRCWQIYENGNWTNLNNTPTDYQKYIDAPPDNVRMNPDRLSRHISAVNDAFIQEVSVFAIGHGIHHFTDRGGEVTVTNSNSSFGGCAAVSRGYKNLAFPQDKNWAVGRIRVPLNLGEKTGNIRRIQLGVISEVNNNRIILSVPLAANENSNSVPAVLLRDKYSLKAGTKIWVEDSAGVDFYADLAENAWNSSNAEKINISVPLTNPLTNEGVPAELAIGKRVYIRRLVDTRTPSERRLSLQLNNTASARLPERNFVLQADPNRAGGGIQRELEAGGREVLVVSGTGIGSKPGPGVAKTAEITLRRSCASVAYENGVYYRSGTVVKYDGKHYQSLGDQVSNSSAPDPKTWGETFVHMPSEYNPEDLQRNEAPIIILDTDTDSSADSQNCGIDFVNGWLGSSELRDQYRTATDYLGAHAFLVALGFSPTAAHAALVPQGSQDRNRVPTNTSHFPTPPSGGAATGLAFWAVEFRRPSVLRLFGHAWEWAGTLNYSKSIPASQQDISPQNKFTYLFTHDQGGRVVPQGSNEDGFNVSPKGLEDIETGATVSVDALGNTDLSESGRQRFEELSAADIEVENLTIRTSVSFPENSSAKTRDEENSLGPVRLADFATITKTGGEAPVAIDNEAINRTPEVVTIAALNRWRQAQKLISADTSEIVIYVKQGTPSRTENDMLEDPPITPEKAIPTLAEASVYANAVIGGGNQVAVIYISPGLYEPASIWNCSVRIEARDGSRQDWPLLHTGPSDGNIGSNTDFFDASDYGNVASSVNFATFSLALRSSNFAGSEFQVNVIASSMIFNRSITFRGGFNFLGIPHLIRAVAQGRLDASRFLVAAEVDVNQSAYTTTLFGDDSNVNVFLEQLKRRNDRNNYQAFTSGSPIVLNGSSLDTANIRDCAFGSALPSRKEAVGANRDPYIATNGIINLRIANIYIYGATEVSSEKINVTSPVPNAANTHYGDNVANAPWKWTQTHHTFIGPTVDGTGSVYIRELGSAAFYNQDPSSSFTRVFYKLNNTYLPNHIHLLNVRGEEAAGDDGPFFDQFIHAPNGFSCTAAFSRGDGFAGFTQVPYSRGFVGQFGSNGYNNVKTRGVLLGNQGNFDEERGAIVKMGLETRTVRSDEQAYTIFKVAGGGLVDLVSRNFDNSFLPLYSPPGGAENFGEPNPVGPDGKKYNPAITTASPAAAGGSALRLNIGLRSYARGISREHGFDITPNVIL